MPRRTSKPRRTAVNTAPVELDCDAQWLWKLYQQRLDTLAGPVAERRDGKSALRSG